MTMPPTTPTAIEDQARALMSAWVEQRGPSPELEARTWAAVSARAQAGELGPALGADMPGSMSATNAATRAAARLRLALVGLGVTGSIVALVFALGDRPDPIRTDARATAIVDEPQEPRATAAVATVEPPSSAEPLPHAPSATSPELAPPSAAEPATIASAPSRRSADKPTAKPKPVSSSPSAANQDDLAAELALLGRARAALKSGDPGAALALLDQHAREFPRGALRSERELTRITAACSAGQLDRAEKVARRFIREHPGSTEAKRLADTCIGDRI
jgi:hypothetical protein